MENTKKPRKTIVTPRQRALAKEIIKNTQRKKPKNAQTVVESVGYSTETAKGKAGKIINAEGTKQALKDYGLTEDLIKTALVEDIKLKEQNRLGELKLGADILGLTKHEAENKTLVLMVTSESASRFKAPVDNVIEHGEVQDVETIDEEQLE